MSNLTTAQVRASRLRDETSRRLCCSPTSRAFRGGRSTSPAETLIFVNWFFAWISAEALRGGKGIIDKYIGDEVMVVFSKEFGSDDPFVEAVQTARWMAEHDVWAFLPHVGIASGDVIVGYAGTPLKYNGSVFGTPVALASRCAGIKPATDGPYWSPQAADG
jgi:class 3 adenylate cyclase